jgi:hypothetical protein
MALVNPNIAMSYRQPDIQGPNALAQFAQIQQIQGGRQAQEMNALKMQEAQAAMEERNALRQLNPASADYESQLFRVNPTLGIQYRKERTAADAAQTEGQIKQTKLLTDKLALLPEAYRMADTPEAYLALHQSVHADPVVGSWLKSVGATPEKGLAALQNAVQTGKFDDLRAASMQSVSQILDSMKPVTVAASSSVYNPRTGAFTQAPAAPFAPEKPPAPPAAVAEYNFAKTPEGGNFNGSFQQFITARAAAGRAPAQPRAEQPPVAVVDPTTGKQVFVSREEALRRRMTPAAAMESLPPKEIQKREAAYPQATSSVKGFETKSTAFIKDLEALRNHPGLSSITGIAAGRLPGLTADGRAAQAIYDKVVAKGGFQALQDMRDASKTGGALGNVSNQEGKQLTASFAAIDRRQEAKDVQAAIDQAIADIQGSQTRMREAYESTYSYKSGGGGAPAASTGVDASNPLLK